jgi:hypothetical protein
VLASSGEAEALQEITRMSRILARSFLPKTVSLLVVIGLANLPIAPRASVIFSNITGPCCGGQAIDGSDFVPQSAAEQFIPDRTYLASDVSAVVVWTGLGSPLFAMAIYSDDTNGLPGLPVGERVTNLTAPPPLGGIVTASFSRPVLLQAGVPFWLVLTPADDATRIGWQTGGSISVPAAVTNSATGLGGWEAFGPNHYQFGVVSIPEESVWAMMLIGFAGLGYAGYRRRGPSRLFGHSRYPPHSPPRSATAGRLRSRRWWGGRGVKRDSGWKTRVVSSSCTTYVRMLLHSDRCATSQRST